MVKINRNTLTAEQFNELVESVGWKVNSNEQVNIALKNSLYTVCILKDDKVVLPNYQGQGIGRIIIEDMMAFIKETNKRGYKCLVELTSASGKEEFYEKFGFERRPCDTSGPGMFLLMK